MNKTLLIFFGLFLLSCSSKEKMVSTKKKSFNTKGLIGFYEEGCTEYSENGKRVRDCPFMDLGNPGNNPKYEIQLTGKSTGYYILHHGKNYDRPSARDTSKLTIIKENKKIVLQIVSKRDTVFEIIESNSPDTLITRNALHENIKYFYPRIDGN